MKLYTEDDVIIGSNLSARKNFSIEATSKAFKILSSNLYSNKIRAIVRELSCNAVDAHNLNNNLDNFDVWVPTRIDPRFIIRDYGPGLSDKDMIELYTTYFASTKTESNDYIGALGLGSKSPFSYTDTFNVVSYHNGIARGYTAMIDNGQPSIMQVFEEPMTPDDKPGIKITVPVKEQDIFKWEYEIKYVYRAFSRVRPRFVNYPDLRIEYYPDREIFDSIQINLGPTHFLPGSTWLYAIMGNILYPITRDVIKPSSNYWFSLGSQYNQKFFVRFPIGLADIAASREELSFDEDQTIPAINKFLNDLDKKEFDIVKKSLLKFELETRDQRREFLCYIGTKFNQAQISYIDKKIKFKSKGFYVTIDSMLKEFYKELSSIETIICYNIDKLKRETNRYDVVTKAFGTSMFSLLQDHVNIYVEDKNNLRAKIIKGMKIQLNQKKPAVFFKRCVTDKNMLTNTPDRYAYIVDSKEHPFVKDMIDHFGEDRVVIIEASSKEAKEYISICNKNSPKAERKTSYVRKDNVDFISFTDKSQKFLPKEDSYISKADIRKLETNCKFMILSTFNGQVDTQSMGMYSLKNIVTKYNELSDDKIDGIITIKQSGGFFDEFAKIKNMYKMRQLIKPIFDVLLKHYKNLNAEHLKYDGAYLNVDKIDCDVSWQLSHFPPNLLDKVRSVFGYQNLIKDNSGHLARLSELRELSNSITVLTRYSDIKILGFSDYNCKKYHELKDLLQLSSFTKKDDDLYQLVKSHVEKVFIENPTLHILFDRNITGYLEDSKSVNQLIKILDTYNTININKETLCL